MLAAESMFLSCAAMTAYFAGGGVGNGWSEL